ncbi:MAG: response regulator [Bacteroidales bacterium]|jgi:CheY-like chemotaxis protein|nr:response regulator [Bacteroidales bacterium]
MGNQGKILIIDDESTHLLLLQTILKDEGYHTEIVDNPQKGLGLLKENDYQVLLLDIMMPGMDGFEVLEKIQQDQRLKNLHVIIISAKTDSWSIKNAMDRGAFDYLTKPINIQDVKNKVKSAMVENILGDD